MSKAALDQLLFFAVLALAGYLLLVRPQRRRMQALQEVRRGVRVGARVVTTAGLYATVTAVEEGTVLLEIAPGVQARFAASAVVRLLDDDGPDEEPPAEAGPAGP